MTEIAADEQDLAKALDSVANAASGGDASDASTASSTATLTSTDLPPIIPPNSPVAPSPFTSISPATADPAPLFNDPVANPSPTNSLPVVQPLAPTNDIGADLSDTNLDPVATKSVDTSYEPVTVTGPLADIKNDALNELRPLVDKLTVSPEEKFDTYLLLIRSTDDESLIAPAHEAAKAIEDEARRAEALLDIIKEIDYLSRPKVTEQ